METKNKYYKICKCGKEKENIRNGYCYDCTTNYRKDYNISKRKIRDDKVVIDGRHYYIMCKCGKEKESLRSVYCNECFRNYTHKKKYSEDNREIDFYTNKLIKFVDKIERRNGICSLEDIFVEMIDLFNYFYLNSSLDTRLSAGKQLTFMWEYIKEIRFKLKK